MTPIGLSIASHSGLPPARVGEVAAQAEQAGFGAVFVAEGHGDALTLCHPVAAATSGVLVGTAIANAQARVELRAYADEQAALEQLKEENPDAYAKPEVEEPAEDGEDVL